MMLTRIGTALALTAALGACANQGGYNGGSRYGTGEVVGTVAGAALGGLIGSEIADGSGTGQLIAVGLGVAVGGLIGNQIGRYMDEQDRESARRAEYEAVDRYPDGQYSRWDNPDNDNYGYTVPQNTYRNSSGQYCREYQTTIVIDGRPETGYGTACRQRDGTWQIVG